MSIPPQITGPNTPDTDRVQACGCGSQQLEIWKSFVSRPDVVRNEFRRRCMELVDAPRSLLRTRGRRLLGRAVQRAVAAILVRQRRGSVDRQAAMRSGHLTVEATPSLLVGVRTFAWLGVDIVFIPAF